MKRSQLFICVFIIFVLLLGTLVIANNSFHTQEDAPFYLDREEERVGVILKGTELSVIEEEGDWVKVNIEAWIPREYITDDYKEEVTEETGTRLRQGFIYDNISFRDFVGMTEIIGEMTNDTGQDYSLANFMVSVYDDEGKLLATSYINMMNFEHGETKTFTGLVDINVGQVKQYRIQYESGF